MGNFNSTSSCASNLKSHCQGNNKLDNFIKTVVTQSTTTTTTTTVKPDTSNTTPYTTSGSTVKPKPIESCKCCGVFGPMCFVPLVPLGVFLLVGLIIIFHQCSIDSNKPIFDSDDIDDTGAGIGVKEEEAFFYRGRLV